ncbi:MAG TPA: oligosaccharide flippase family protein [Gaiellaceae bacterium]|jgi:O-antigen/teichoic acid export membrane protein|nr:oligosaccharide flippase family protein [Gaiellaceae bacterium]
MLFWARAAGNAGFFTAVLILARSLGPTGRGTIAFITVSALVLARVAGFGMGEATTVLAARRVEARGALLSNLILFMVTSTLFLAGLGFVVLLSLADERPAGVDLPELTILGGAAVAIALIEAGGAFLVGCGRLQRLALITATAYWIYPCVLAVVWLVSGLTVTRAALAWLVSEAIIAFVLLRQSARGVGLARPSRSLLLESILFGLRAWIGSLARLLNFRTDQILMGFLASEAALGIYAVAVNASEALLYLPAATATALLPVAARAEPRERAEHTLGAFRSAALVTAGAVAVAAVLGPVLLPAVFGSAFDGSVEPFLLLVPGAFGFAATAIFSSALMASSSPGRSSLGPFVSLVVGLALDIVLIPRFGATGAAAAASTAFIAGGAAALFSYRRLSPFAWRALLLPRRGDLQMLRALASPLRLRSSF